MIKPKNPLGVLNLQGIEKIKWRVFLNIINEKSVCLGGYKFNINIKELLGLLKIS